MTDVTHSFQWYFIQLSPIAVLVTLVIGVRRFRELPPGLRYLVWLAGFELVFQRPDSYLDELISGRSPHAQASHTLELLRTTQGVHHPHRCSKFPWHRSGSTSYEPRPTSKG